MIVGRENIKVGIEAGCDFVGSLPGVDRFNPIGSALYLNEVNDIDFLVLIEEKVGQDLMDWCEGLRTCGFIDCGEDYETGQFLALRKNDLNLIVTADLGFYERFKKASMVNEFLGLKNKYARMGVCWIIRDGLTVDQVQEKLQQDYGIGGQYEPLGPEDLGL